MEWRSGINGRLKGKEGMREAISNERPERKQRFGRRREGVKGIRGKGGGEKREESSKYQSDGF